MDAPQKNLMGRCENNDGKPARFSGCGHTFCVDCRDAWISSFKASQTLELPFEPDNQLPFIYDYIA